MTESQSAGCRRVIKVIWLLALNANRLQLTIAAARLQGFFSINLKKDEIPPYLMNKFWLS
tara:strand:+ start:110 stop:289 length:180 start_codon:yes stop_codon:yes gene_type:complete